MNTKFIYCKFVINKNGNLKTIKSKKDIIGPITDFLLNKCPDLLQVLNIENFDFGVKETLEEELENQNSSDSETDDKNKNRNQKKYKKRNTKEKKSKQIKEKVFDRLIGRNFPTRGFIQSGKTNFMISTATWMLLNGKSSIIVVRNYTDDSAQIQERIKSFQQEMSLMLINSGLDPGMFKVELATNGILPEVLSGEKPMITIALYNNSALQKITKSITDEQRRKFVLFIDEADLLHKTVIGDEKTAGDKTNAATELNNIKNNSFCCFSVTGTVLDNILKDDVKTEDLIVLKKPDNYKDHSSFTYVDLPQSCKFTSKTTDNILENDPNIVNFLDMFQNLPTIKTS
jgi:hypothetical protein